MRAWSVVLLILIVNGCVTVSNQADKEQPVSIANQTLAALTAGLPGQYGNFAQLWVAQEGNPELRHWRLQVSSLGAGPGVAWFAFRQSLAAQPQVSQQQIIRISSLTDDQLELNFSPLPDTEQLSANSLEGLAASVRFIEGCQVVLAITGRRVAGQTRAQQCRFPGPAGSNLILTKDFALENDQIHIGERVTTGNHPEDPQQDKIFYFQRQSMYQGWLGIRDEDQRWHPVTNVRLSSDGDQWPVALPDGTDSGFYLRLSQVPWHSEEAPILRLDLIDKQQGTPVGNAWTAAGSEQIGLQLDWIQVGLEKVTTP